MKKGLPSGMIKKPILMNDSLIKIAIAVYIFNNHLFYNGLKNCTKP